MSLYFHLFSLIGTRATNSSKIFLFTDRSVTTFLVEPIDSPLMVPSYEAETTQVEEDLKTVGDELVTVVNGLTYRNGVTEDNRSQTGQLINIVQPHSDLKGYFRDRVI